MPTNQQDFKRNLSADTTRLMSPNIWADFPIDSVRSNPSLGIYNFDNFQDFPLIGTQTTQIAHGRYKVFNTGAGTVVPVTSVNSVEVGTVLSVALDTNNDSGGLADSYPSEMMTGYVGDPTTTINSMGLLCFEGCVAVSTIAVDTVGFFLGLAEVDQITMATAVPFNAGSDTITNTWSGLGFFKGEDALGVVDTVYTDRATSFTNIGNDALTISAAYTFIKLGFVYDPKRTTDQVRFFSNNVELTDKMSRTTLRATTNLKANALGRIFSVIADSGLGTAYLKWWAIGQLYGTY